jgi:type IV pilus assembly protein PilA
MLMALKKNQKGLTLIELLAVLVIVGIIAAIAIPAITGTIAKSKTKADTATEKMVQEAALRYVLELDTEPSTNTTISTTTLVSEGYLNAEPVYQDKGTRTYTAVKTGNSWAINVSKTGGTATPTASPTT